MRLQFTTERAIDIPPDSLLNATEGPRKNSNGGPGGERLESSLYA